MKDRPRPPRMPDQGKADRITREFQIWAKDHGGEAQETGQKLASDGQDASKVERIQQLEDALLRIQQLIPDNTIVARERRILEVISEFDLNRAALRWQEGKGKLFE